MSWNDKQIVKEIDSVLVNTHSNVLQQWKV